MAGTPQGGCAATSQRRALNLHRPPWWQSPLAQIIGLARSGSGPQHGGDDSLGDGVDERTESPGVVGAMDPGQLRVGLGGASRQIAGETPVPGGWNRIQLRVDDLDAHLASLSSAGVEPVDGVVDGRGGRGGRQALVRDPSGNLVELFQPHGA